MPGSSSDRDEMAIDEGEMEGSGSSLASPTPSSEGYASVDEEEDELVDEMEDAPPMETNRRTRRPALRVKLSRSKAASAPSKKDASASESGSGASDGSVSDAGDAPMTARQIARMNRERGIANEELEELPMEDASKRHKLTDTELALRRSETARRRRNQSEKKLEDDKIETINRLLKKQAGKVRGRDRGDDATELHERPRHPREVGPKPLFRYVSRAEGALLAVPRGPPFAPSGEGLYDQTLRTAMGSSREAWNR